MKKRINIIGGGASALMLAAELDPRKFEVHIYEGNKSLGRKFLVAGKGGFNVSHSEAAALFIERYTPSAFLKPAFSAFNNVGLIRWLQALGIGTYTGSSGRIFPKKGIKPAEVLKKFLDRIKQNRVLIHYSSTWEGWTSNGELLFQTAAGKIAVSSDITVFCLGGASWPKTGSRGDWAPFFESRGVLVNPFLASNCAFKIIWPKEIKSKIVGKALKNCSISCGGHAHAGEVVLSSFGMEGSGIYPLSPHIRKEIQATGHAAIFIDLKPSLSSEKIIEKLHSKRKKESYTQFVKSALNLSETALLLLKQFTSKEDFLNLNSLAARVKHLPLRISGTGPIEEAISTVGGISLKEIDAHFELKKMPGNYVIGEMLDYDAPTGGYLLQSCFSMGHYLAHYLNR